MAKKTPFLIAEFLNMFNLSEDFLPKKFKTFFASPNFTFQSFKLRYILQYKRRSFYINNIIKVLFFVHVQ